MIATLLVLGWSGAAAASATIEIDPKYENFESRSACEKALEQRHSAALSRVASLPPAERHGNKVAELERNGDQQLSYAEMLDLAGDSPDADMPGRQTELFTCLGARLEYRIDLAQ
ncbi:MAG: hypothetical protein ABIW83_09840 [Allosphingosinicella sp.]